MPMSVFDYAKGTAEEGATVLVIKEKHKSHSPPQHFSRKYQLYQVTHITSFPFSARDILARANCSMIELPVSYAAIRAAFCNAGAKVMVMP